MNTKEKRIKLAEAMGLPKHPKGFESQTNKGYPENNGPWENDVFPGFNPFTDANDDYAVLEWMRRQGDLPPVFTKALFAAWNYKIGDYSRAAPNVTAEADQAHDDQWLANQIVALGVGQYPMVDGNKWTHLYMLPDWIKFADAKTFICDWRVAGAMQELVQKHGWDIEIHWQPQHEDCPHPAVYVHVWHRDTETHIRCDSDVPCRTIIETCVSAIPESTDHDKQNHEKSSR